MGPRKLQNPMILLAKNKLWTQEFNMRVQEESNYDLE